MTSLDSKFIALAQKSPVEIDHGSRTARFEATTASVGTDESRVTAELAVFVDDVLVGYITPFTADEHGAVPVDKFGTEVPATFHTLEGALEQLIPGAADGLETPALQE